jgi:hypothetical protein
MLDKASENARLAIMGFLLGLLTIVAIILAL